MQEAQHCGDASDQRRRAMSCVYPVLLRWGWGMKREYRKGNPSSDLDALKLVSLHPALCKIGPLTEIPEVCTRPRKIRATCSSSVIQI